MLGFKKTQVGNSLVAQWLGRGFFTSGAQVRSLVREVRSLQAMWYGQNHHLLPPPAKKKTEKYKLICSIYQILILSKHPMFTSLCVFIYFFFSLCLCVERRWVARSIKHFCLGTIRGFVISHENLMLRIQLSLGSTLTGTHLWSLAYHSNES